MKDKVRVTLVALALSLSAAGCRGPSPRPHVTAAEEPAPPAVAAGAELDLPAGWAELSPSAFERWVELALPDGATTALAPLARAELRAALSGFDLRAVRAAVVLGRAGTPACGELLLARLEERAVGPERPSDAADVVAAAALAGIDGVRDGAARLEALAVGDEPHGDLEVRVECASSALALGRDAVIPFLLRVLRAGTPAGRADLQDWPASNTLAWSKTRAAEALSARAGVPRTFQPDASFEAQAAETLELARRLGVELP